MTAAEMLNRIVRNPKRRSNRLIGCALALGIGSAFAGSCEGQGTPLPRYETLGFQSQQNPAPYSSRVIASHELVPLRLIIERPVTREEIVSETVYRDEEVTVSRPVWVDETRYRDVERQVPVTRERTLLQTQTVEKPVIEKIYEERPVSETVMREVVETEARQELVRRPVTRTGYRDETVLVEKPVERTVLQPESVTAWRPVQQTQTVYSPTMVPLQQPQTPAGASAPYLQRRTRGYVNDPATGQQVWQRGGLHWVRTPDPCNTCQPSTVLLPAYVPQQQTSVAYVPEVVQQYRPVVVTETARQYETRRVPYSIEAVEETLETRNVQVTRMKPVVETRMESVPVERLRYEQQTVTREIPVRETVYKTELEREAYTVQVQKAVTETSVKKVPHQVRKTVTRQSTEQIVRDVIVRIPLTADDQRTATLPRELRIELADASTRIPADSSIVEYEWIRSLAVGPAPVTTPAADADGTVTTQKISTGDFAPVTPDPNRKPADAAEPAEKSILEKDSGEAAAGEAAAGGGAAGEAAPFRRGIEPESPKAADRVPEIGPSDGT